MPNASCPTGVELVLQTEEQAHINAGRVDVVIGAANEPTGNGGDPTVGLLVVNGMSTNLERDGLRRALSLAIDRNALAADLGGSLWPADGLIPGGIRTGEGGELPRCQRPAYRQRPGGLRRPLHPGRHGAAPGGLHQRRRHGAAGHGHAAV